MFRRLAAALLSLAALPGPLPCPAEVFRPKPTRLNEHDIERAVRQGIAWLKTAPSPVSHRDLDADELILYSLFIGGVPHDDPVFDGTLRKVVDKAPARTYAAALTAMVLAEMDATGYRWKLEEIARFLVDTQCRNGQWGYGEALPRETRTPSPAPRPKTRTPAAGSVAAQPIPYGVRYPDGWQPRRAGTSAGSPRTAVPRRLRGPEQGDNSNSQYAALGLRACWESGIDPDPGCVRDALAWWEQTPCGDGSWNYSRDWNWDTDGSRGWGSMTAGGITALVIYRNMLGLPWRNDRRVDDGLKWLALSWNLSGNPGAEGLGAAAHHYYFLYGLERAGMIYGTDRIGAHDWYDEGAKYLMDHQRADGSWKGDGGNEVHDTCFAILFLRRATRPVTPSGCRLPSGHLLVDGPQGWRMIPVTPREAR
jgi:hypothetical protein